MTDDVYIVAITALLPLMAVLLVLQSNPYQALVIRGILGAIAALVYALYGAADVALTEALVGTMLSITLYAIAVRSSMTVRIGFVEGASIESASTGNVLTEGTSTEADILTDDVSAKRLFPAVEEILDRHYVRVEILPYASASAMTAALKEKEIHATYESCEDSLDDCLAVLKTRVERLYDILHAGLPPVMRVTYSDQALNRELD